MRHFVFDCGIDQYPRYPVLLLPGIQQFPTNVKYLMNGSAICTEQHWLFCTDCKYDQFMRNEERMKLVNVTIAHGGTKELTFAQRNECDGAPYTQGMINWVC